ncbi:MAG: hypothetical protein OHK93_008815 [Ramalina farinacea]|uniref:Uncharacterized protein n=1 Tax=Ramalina farinacea TaxID=258253 RepID=A0AA43QPW0_9LECA|nr:hypothetical protein [Ramalina farinacea]
MFDGPFHPLCKTYHPEDAPCPRFATAHPRHQPMLVHPLNAVTLPPHDAPDAPAAAAAAPAHTSTRAAPEQPATRRSIRAQNALASGEPTTWHYIVPGEDGVMERIMTRDRFKAMAHRRFRGRKGKGKQGEGEGEGQEEQEQEQQQEQQQQPQEQQEQQGQQQQQKQQEEEEEDDEGDDEFGRDSDSVVVQRLKRSRDGWKKRAERLAAEVKRLEARLAEEKKKQG